MRIPTYRPALAVVAVSGLALTALLPATAASAAPAATRVAAVSTATTASLPPIATWLADVTAVTDVASQYLSTRLPDPSIKAAIVLDIDNTALETTYSGNAISPPATPPVLALSKQAAAAGAKIFFVTARPEIEFWTQSSLTNVGYQVDGLYLRPTFDFDSNQTLKTNARIAIENLGYTIVANIGNSDSDLAGGHAERTFKLPDYNGLLD